MNGNLKPHFILFASVILFAIGIISMPARAGDQPTALTVVDIIHRSAQQYASLTNYSDEGATASKLGHITSASYTFTIHLARTNLYQICWYEPDQQFIPKGVVWSAGDGDYLWMKGTVQPQKSASMEMALGGAAGISGGATASIPGTFFHLRWGNQLGLAAEAARRLPDESVGDIACFVLTHGHDGRTNTLWIGKKDFLIHQMEHDTSGSLVKKMLEAQAKTNPQVRNLLKQSGPEMFQDSRTIEIHRAIKVNQPMSKTDFEFHVPDKTGH